MINTRLKMEGKAIKFYNGDEVEKRMDHDELINSLEKGFVNFSNNHGVVQPVRTAVEVKEHNG